MLPLQALRGFDAVAGEEDQILRRKLRTYLEPPQGGAEIERRAAEGLPDVTRYAEAVLIRRCRERRVQILPQQSRTRGGGSRARRCDLRANARPSHPRATEIRRDQDRRRHDHR